MTIKIGRYKIVLFQITKLETFKFDVDTAAAKKQADEIKESAQFAELKARAAAARAARA